MPHFHVVLSSLAHVKPEFDLMEPSQEEANRKALADANAGNALWRYNGLVEDAEIEVD
jgi:hypothetical protein